MDLENQRRVKELSEKHGPENVVVIVGAAEGEAAGLAAETVENGDPTFAGPLTGVQLGLACYHICEPEIKAEVDADLYDEQIGMMEMVLDVDDICSEMTDIRSQYCKYKPEKHQE
jgi:betaine reductase